MNRLLALKPEGEQVVLQAEVQIRGQYEVCLKANSPRPPIAWDDEVEVLAFWKRKRFLFQQKLQQIRRQRFGTPPPSPDLSSLQAEHRLSVDWSERWPALQQEVEAWLRTMPSRVFLPVHLVCCL